MDSEGSHNHSVVSTTDIGTLIFTKVLEDPPGSANDLLAYITRIAVPCPTMRVRALVPRTRNPQCLCKVPEKEAILAASISSRSVKTDRHKDGGLGRFHPASLPGWEARLPFPQHHHLKTHTHTRKKTYEARSPAHRPCTTTHTRRCRWWARRTPAP